MAGDAEIVAVLKEREWSRVALARELATLRARVEDLETLESAETIQLRSDLDRAIETAHALRAENARLRSLLSKALAEHDRRHIDSSICTKHEAYSHGCSAWAPDARMVLVPPRHDIGCDAHDACAQGPCRHPYAPAPGGS